MCVHTRVCVYACVHACMHVCVCACVCLCVCVLSCSPPPGFSKFVRMMFPRTVFWNMASTECVVFLYVFKH